MPGFFFHLNTRIFHSWKFNILYITKIKRYNYDEMYVCMYEIYIQM